VTKMVINGREKKTTFTFSQIFIFRVHGKTLCTKCVNLRKIYIVEKKLAYTRNAKFLRNVHKIS